MHIFKNTKYDFLRWRWAAIALSWVIILAGAVTVWTRGIPLGVEFSGGTVVIAQFDRAVSVAEVRSALTAALPNVESTVQAYGEPAQHQVLVRVPLVGEEAGQKLSSTQAQIEAALRKSLGKIDVIGSELVGPTVGGELTRKGISATVLSLGGILLYIAFRYQFSFGVGAIVATVHDLLITLAFLAFFRYDMTLNVIAALLTIAGYSTNDTIVIFDRVRENVRSMRRDSMDHVINVAINQTLGRTIITSGTTLVTALALFFFGGEVLHGFAFTMMIGVITGTYSSVFVAAAIVSLWRGSSGRVASHAPAAAAPAQPAGRSKQRKARA